MKLSRNVTNSFNWILDNLIPPIIRDSTIFSKPLFWLLFGKKAKLFMNFKKEVVDFNTDEIIERYKELSDVHIKRETDLNKESVNFILNNIEGKSVLDIACGRGYLSRKIVEKRNIKVTGIDFIIPDEIEGSENPIFLNGTIEKIPFSDKHVDTVICSHTLEHVIDIQQAISELRRVCKKRLIIVLPKQREYKFTFDLHVHFFPYKYSVLNLMKNSRGICLCLNKDWVYYEDLN